MNEKLEHILEDIYALDASLKARDTEVRALISELMALRPDAPLDRSFREALRERLIAGMATSPIRAHAPEPSLWWWLLRAAPIGAIALLILMIMPETPQQNTDVSPPATPALETMSVESADEAEMPVMNQRSLKAPAGGAGDGMADDAMMMMQAPQGNMLDVWAQVPAENVVIQFVSLEQPGYVALYEDADGTAGTFVGVSPLLSAGMSYQVTLPTSRLTVHDEMLHAALFTDDGDGLFKAGRDLAVIDASTGMPVATMFIISWDAEVPEAAPMQ